MRLRPGPAPACRPGREIQKGGIVHTALKSEVARLLDRGGGAESSEIENDGNRAPTHAKKKSRFSAWFSLSVGSVLPARVIDRTLATIFCGSMAAAICASKRRRGCSRKVTFAARLGRRLDGDLRQQDAVTRG